MVSSIHRTKSDAKEAGGLATQIFGHPDLLAIVTCRQKSSAKSSTKHAVRNIIYVNLNNRNSRDFPCE